SAIARDDHPHVLSARRHSHSRDATCAKVVPPDDLAVRVQDESHGRPGSLPIRGNDEPWLAPSVVDAVEVTNVYQVGGSARPNHEVVTRRAPSPVVNHDSIVVLAVWLHTEQ